MRPPVVVDPGCVVAVLVGGGPAADGLGGDLAGPRADPAGRERAKNLLWASGKLADWAIGLGLEPAPEVLLHPYTAAEISGCLALADAQPTLRATGARDRAGPPWGFFGRAAVRADLIHPHPTGDRFLTREYAKNGEHRRSKVDHVVSEILDEEDPKAADVRSALPGDVARSWRACSR